MNKYLNSLLTLFYPNLCTLCKNPLIEGEESLCLHCLCRLSYTHFHQDTKNRVYELFLGKEIIETASAFLYFEKGGLTQKLIHSIKYHGNRKLGYQMGIMAAKELKDDPVFRFNEIDIIIPVPLHPKRKKVRGFNQSEYIAQGLSQVLNTPVNSHILERTLHSSSQVTKNLYDRWLNSQSLFAIKDPNLIQNKHILLVDDVITSGSTLCDCTHAFSSQTTTRISIFGLSVTR